MEVLQNPFFSIIIPLYNKERTIKTTLNTVLNQTFQDFEIVVVNDGSSDKSRKMVLTVKDPRIKLIDQENGGVSKARNKGVENASGTYIFFLDADDVMMQDCLAVMHSMIIHLPQYNIYASNFQLFDEKGVRPFITDSYKGTQIFKDPHKTLLDNQLFLRTGNTVIWRDYAIRFKFNEKISRYEDLDYFLRISKDQRVVYTSQCCFQYCLNNAELSTGKGDVSKEYAYHATLSNNYTPTNLLIANNIAITITSKLKSLQLRQAFRLIRKQYRAIPIIINRIVSLLISKIR